MLCLLAVDNVWTNPVNGATRGFRGDRGPDPSLWKITNSIGLYRNMQSDPLHLGKVGPPGNVEPSFSMEYRKKAMITGLPLQSKLVTYKKKKNKKNVRAFFQSVGLGPLSPPPNPTKMQCINSIGYALLAVIKVRVQRSGIDTIK